MVNTLLTPSLLQSGSDSRLLLKRRGLTHCHLPDWTLRWRTAYWDVQSTTFNHASDLCLRSCAIHWKTIIEAQACLSSRVISHWRDSLTSLTFDFSKSLWVKWGGQQQASSITGGEASQWMNTSIKEWGLVAGKPMASACVYSKAPRWCTSWSLWHKSMHTRVEMR